MFPDQATLYIGAIEDGKYKDEKIHCTLRLLVLLNESLC